MFTLSFYRNGSTDKTVVATDLYSVSRGPGMTIVAVNPMGSDKPGMDFKLCKHELTSNCHFFASMYVTNEAGKTIDHFEAPNEPLPACGSLESV